MKLWTKVQKRITLFSGGIALLAALAVGSTMAYLQATSSKTNQFVAPVANIKIIENASSFQFDSNLSTVKEVSVQNASNLPVYIRVKLVPIWRNQNGEGAGIPVTGLKYGYGENGDKDKPQNPWFYNDKDGCYYYKNPVKPNEFTSYLIRRISIDSKANQPDYNLEVQVIADSIQAVGKDQNGNSPAQAAWGFDPAKT